MGEKTEEEKEERLRQELYIETLPGEPTPGETKEESEERSEEEEEKGTWDLIAAQKANRALTLEVMDLKKQVSNLANQITESRALPPDHPKPEPKEKPESPELPDLPKPLEPKSSSPTPSSHHPGRVRLLKLW